jgi:hypothetical protein
MARDPFKSPDYRRYAKRFFDEVAPMIKSSAYMVTIAPPTSAADVKIATELGFAILLDKPLVVLAPRGRHIAEKLLRIADHVITGDMDTPAGMAEMQARLKAVLTQ